MTSIAVRQVKSPFVDMTSAQAGRSAAGSTDFQDIWNGQMNRNAEPQQKEASAAAGKQALSGEKLQRGSSLRIKEDAVRKEPAPQAELLPEGQEQAMEVLGAAAQQLVQEIADTFGISVEEVQEAMGELGMGQMDVLDASKLSALLLSLGGAEDMYALVTDGALYDNYRALMDRLEGMLGESAEALELEPESLLKLVQELEPESLQKLVQEPAPVPEELPRAERPKEEQEVQAQPEEADGKTDAPLQKSPEAQQGMDSEDADPEGRRSEGKSEREPQYIFAQDAAAGRLQPQTEQVQGVQPSPWSESTQEIMDQIMDYMKLHLNADSTSLEMRLHPASLGTLQIQLASKAGTVTANFIAQNETVKAALETQMIQLKEQFAEQGIKVESIQVTVEPHAFERNLDEQGRGRGQQPEKKGRARRVSAGGSVSMEASASPEGEDRAPAAGIVSGSTVEYTA